MECHVGVFVVVQACSSESFVFPIETQWFDQMQIGSRVGTESDDVSCILGNLGVKQYDV